MGRRNPSGLQPRSTSNSTAACKEEEDKGTKADSGGHGVAFAHSQSPRLQTETLSRGTIDLFVVEQLVYQKKICNVGVVVVQ